MENQQELKPGMTVELRQQDRGNEIEAFINDILTKCANKGFSMRDVDRLCCGLQNKYHEMRSRQVNKLTFAYSTLSEHNADSDLESEVQKAIYQLKEHPSRIKYE